MGSFARDRSTSLLLGVEVSVEVQVVDGWLDVNVAARLARLLDGGDITSQRERAESRLNILEVVVDVLGLLLWHAGQLLLSSGDLGLDLLELLKGGEFLFTLLLLGLSDLLLQLGELLPLLGNELLSLLTSWDLSQLLLDLGDLLLDLGQLLLQLLLVHWLLDLLGELLLHLLHLLLLVLWHLNALGELSLELGQLLLHLLHLGLHLLLGDHWASDLLLGLGDLLLQLGQLLLQLSDLLLNLNELLLLALQLLSLSLQLLFSLSDLHLDLGNELLGMSQ